MAGSSRWSLWRLRISPMSNTQGATHGRTSPKPLSPPHPRPSVPRAAAACPQARGALTPRGPRQDLLPVSAERPERYQQGGQGPFRRWILRLSRGRSDPAACRAPRRMPRAPTAESAPRAGAAAPQLETAPAPFVDGATLSRPVWKQSFSLPDALALSGGGAAAAQTEPLGSAPLTLLVAVRDAARSVAGDARPRGGRGRKAPTQAADAVAAARG